MAVLAVTAVHAWPELLRGGFVGVDIFFVLSGYLISTLIFRALQAGQFDLRDFYIRRVRRLFPALCTVLLACLLFSAFFTFPSQARQVGQHVAAGAVFASNLALWLEAGYFDAASETKPLLHLWSLGIEEQFYILWPLAALIVFRWRQHGLKIIVGLLLLSFALNVIWVVAKAKGTFFLLPLSQAHRMIGEADLPRDRRTALLDLFDETLLISAGGELADTAFGLGLESPSLEDSLLVAESKTAMYSFRAPLRAGALLAGAGPDVLHSLDETGRLLGRAFQLVDDLLGVFAPEAETGKSNLSDLREGKRTPLMLHARSMPVWAELADHVGRPDLDEGTAVQLRRALARSVAPAMVQAAVRADLTEVLRILSGSTLPAAMSPVVGSVCEQIGGALDDVALHIEEARCHRG